VHLSDRTATTVQARHLQEALLERLEKGREWATPAVESALRRALAGVDSGIDVASPRLQASLRAIAEELAGGVETVTPRLHERIARIIPDGTPLDSTASMGKHPRKAWWVAGVVVAAALGGLALWRAFWRPEPSVEPPRTEDRPDQMSPNRTSPPQAVPPSRT
jgi:hypothetical protein